MLGPGVVVEAGAEVHDSVVFTDSVVRAGATVHWSVVDTGCVVEADARLGEPDTPALDDPDAVALVGRGSRWWAPTRRGAGWSRAPPAETCDV